MEVESQDSLDIYIDFYKLRLKERNIKLIPLWAILSFFLISDLLQPFTWNKLIASILAIIFIAFITYYLPLVVIKRRLKKRFSSLATPHEKRKLTISNEGLEQFRGEQYLLRTWNSIQSAGVNARFIYLTLVDKSVVVIPKKDFATGTDAANFLGEVNLHIRKANPNYFPSLPTIEKPNYSLGLLCFIPLIGAIVGFVFILQGIFKYKDKWFALIGLGGIIFTLLIYGSMFIYDHSEAMRKNLIPMSQTQMGSLVKDIEFYKIEHGNYPDSLQQLQIKNTLVNIYDPVQQDASGMYNYHRTGNKYTLFSSGLDGKPNTADDIYPALKVDTSKIGLIVK